MDRWMGHDGGRGNTLLHKWVPLFNTAGKTEYVDNEPCSEFVVTNDFGKYYDITPTGWDVSDLDSPEAGAHGVKRLTGDASTFAGSGIRQAQKVIPANGFGGGREFAWVARFKCPGTTPVVTDADYGVHMGLCSQEAGIAESQDGPYWFYSKAVSKWTLKTARSGTRSTFTSAIDWEDTFHWMGYHVNADATVVTPFVNGVAQTAITANIQPADGIQPCLLADSLGASTDDLIIDLDHIAWGFTDP